MPLLDRVIDINYYPSDEAAASNPRWRPVGLGLMGLQDVFFALRLPFDSPEARELSTRVAGGDLPDRARGVGDLAATPRPAPGVRRDPRGRRRAAARPLGRLARRQAERWAALREAVAEHGLRNSLLVAIAPTATIASIAGCYECIEPQVSNLFKRETLSGEFLQVNAALTRELKARGLWTAEVREAIKRAEGSVQGIAELPDDVRELLPHGLGAAAAGADRHGGRALAVHRPEPVAQPLHRRTRRSGSSRRCTSTPGSPA